jgi:hypothetical protein
MKKISVISICLMLILTIIPLAQADGEIATDNLDKEYFEVYDIADFGQCARGVTTADFNDDGNMDFAVSYSTLPFEYSTISIFYNEGDLAFRQVDVYTFETGYIDSLDAGDYDNDGDIDLMFSYSETRFSGYIRGVICILDNDGNNNFEKRTQIVRRGFVLRFIGESRIHPKITSADYDNDGDIDILVGDNSGRVEFYKNNGNGEFRTQGIVFNYDILSWGVTSADFTGDNLIDFIVVANERRAMGKMGHMFLKQNTGLPDCFEYGLGTEIANPGDSSALSSLDYDNDGVMDVVMGSGLSLYMNRDESFQRFRTGWYNSGSLHAGGLSSADFNNDGFDDIVAGGSSGTVRLLINNYGEFPPTEPYIDGKMYDIEPGEEYEYTFTIADINNDDVYLLVGWEDETSTDWLGPFASGSKVTLSHTWQDKGTFTFRAKVKDVHGTESDWTKITVNVQDREVMNSNKWNLVSIKGQCEGWSVGTVFHVFSLWATHQPMSIFDVTVDSVIRINGELYPLDELSDVRMKGFVGTSFFPFRWVMYDIQGIEPPHDITVFGLCKQVEIV